MHDMHDFERMRDRARASMARVKLHSFSRVERSGFLAYLSNALIAFQVTAPEVRSAVQARLKTLAKKRGALNE